MHTVTVSEKLDHIYKKYFNDKDQKRLSHLSKEDTDQLLSIKRKLASLEKERCLMMRENKDTTVINQKIAREKERFSASCRKQ